MSQNRQGWAICSLIQNDICFSCIQQRWMLKSYLWLWKGVISGWGGKRSTGTQVLLLHVLRLGRESIHSFILQIFIPPFLHVQSYAKFWGYRNELNVHNFCPHEIYSPTFQHRDEPSLNVLTSTILPSFSLNSKDFQPSDRKELRQGNYTTFSTLNVVEYK